MKYPNSTAVLFLILLLHKFKMSAPSLNLKWKRTVNIRECYGCWKMKYSKLQIPQFRASFRAENLSLGKDWELAVELSWAWQKSIACGSRRELRHSRRGKLVVLNRYSCDSRKNRSHNNAFSRKTPRDQKCILVALSPGSKAHIQVIGKEETKANWVTCNFQLNHLKLLKLRAPSQSIFSLPLV